MNPVEKWQRRMKWLNFTRPIRDFAYGIENLIYYLPVIWKDKDWDHYYISALLHRKFSRMAKFYAKYGCSVHHLEQAEICQDIANAAERLCEEEYHLVPKRKGTTYIHLNGTEDENPPTAQDDIDLICSLLKRNYLDLWD